jgi:hypothetical protein
MSRLTTVFLLLITSALSAQNYGNEWIDYNRQYYRFPVLQSGVHQISQQALAQAGVPTQTITSGQYRLFGREKEIPIRVADGGDNQLDPGDFIEFFAEANNGWLDSLLYDDPTTIGNPAYSLCNDTVYYFLSWGSGINQRFNNETDINFSSYTPKTHVTQINRFNYNSNFYAGVSTIGSFSSFYVPGEGWGGPNINGGQSNAQLSINVPTPQPYTGSDGFSPMFHAKSYANSNAAFTGQGNHHLRWEIGGGSGHILYDEVFIGMRQTIVDTVFPVNLVNNGNTNILFRVIADQGATTDFQSANYIQITYPRLPNLNNQNYADFLVTNSTTQAKVRLDITNANLVNPRCYVLQGNIPRFVPMVQDGSTWRLLIPNSASGQPQRVIISSENAVVNVNQITPVNGTGTFANIPALNFESAYLIVYNKQLSAGAQQYASYRSSSAGGNHNVVLLDVDELYMQFGGGIPKHILGIRRAANLAYNLSSDKPVGLLILGKGIREANEPNTLLGPGTRKNQTSYNNSLVPSYGYPSSDICITAKFNGSPSWAPFIPTGRIAAKNNNEVFVFLEKLQIYENEQNQNSTYNKETKEWQKQILHFGGGGNATEQNLFQLFLNNMKGIIETEEYGGHVTSFFKSTSDPFNPVLTQTVNTKLQSGVSLMTFFGHATASGFDQNIDNPENWGNAGKYPMVIGNSCYTGDIFQPNALSASESFVLTPSAGSIGFISSTKLGFASYLNTYTTELYRQISPKNYGLPFGQQIVNTIQEIEGSNTNVLTESTVTQMTLHGDPLMKLNWHTLPEIDLTTQDVFFTPAQIDLTTDSITANIVLTNLGKSITEPFEVVLRRNFPNASIDSVYSVFVNELHYKDTIRITMPVQSNIGVGLNLFDITADIPSFIDEIYDEYGNNQITTSLFIDIDGISPVLPYNYAVVPNDSVVLKASTTNPIAGFNTYRFEIDTTDLFNSPFKRYALVSGLGGVKEVFPSQWLNASNNMSAPLVLEDSVCYFWRVAVDSVTPQWVEHSFQYIPGKEGWGQDHFYQFKNGGFSGVNYDRPSRQREFQPVQRIIGCDVYDNASNQNEIFQTLWTINGQEAEYGMCTTTPSLHVAVIDPLTMEPWGTFNNGANPQNQFGNVNNGSACRNRVEYYFIFRQNTAAQLQAFENMILNEVPDGHYILVYTTMRALYSQWQANYPALFNTMSGLGAANMSPTSPERAFIFFYQKGNPTFTVQEVHATQANEFITMSSMIESSISTGLETSTIIGPAAEWHTVYWKQDGLETPNMDETRLIIRGLDINKNVQIEIDTLFTHNDSIQFFNTILPAQQYPYLQLRAVYKDTANLTPAQVDRWHVLYETLPEAAINGSNAYTWLPGTIQAISEGEEISFAVDVKNISHLDMDSLLINYWIVNQLQQVVPIPYSRQAPLLSGDVIRDTVSFSTVGLGGINTFRMEVNPYINGMIKDQPELAHFNNILQIPFEVGQDDLNPILDVTFDGLHILNGDIVNPESEIVITLKDDNPFLVMNQDADTSLFGIYLKEPSGVQKRVPFIDGNGIPVMQWVPANDDNLKFKIIFPTNFTEEGEYELLVQGSDKSGNLSGDLEFRVKFEVILSTSITYMMNYPNPFSTSTRFVFTLTGNRVPDEIKIQIMTVTGRVVREITEDELGPMRIGRNISQYAWDGRDEFGDQLANGVYLYRMIAQIDGEDIEHRSSGADQFFKRNWGKMYLMR